MIGGNGSLRDYIYSISPPWLQNIIGNKLLYAPGLAADGLMEKMNQAMKANKPGQCDPTCLPYIGSDRGITQGPSELAASYGSRLSQAWDDWGYAGAPRTDMRESIAYLLPETPMATVVSSGVQGTKWSVYLAGANTAQAPSYYSNVAGNWDWDSLDLGGSPVYTAATQWWRCFLIIFCVAPNNAPLAQLGTWGSTGQKWGTQNGYSWGTTSPSSVGRGIVAILEQWHAEHSWFPWVIFSFSSTLFQPQGATGTANPGSNWGRWSKVNPNVNGPTGSYVASRSASAIYANAV
jgi:hypothetical protein